MTHTATVETLTAEVRVLMVGNRQVTLSVFRQLDWVEPDEIEPFGRVSDPRDKDTQDTDGVSGVTVVGKDTGGQLVRSRVRPPWIGQSEGWIERMEGSCRDEYRQRLAEGREREPYVNTWANLSKIVLAGLT